MSIILYNNYNKKKVLVPKFQDQLWILDKLIMVNYMYYFPPNTKPLTNNRAYLVPKVIYSTLSIVMLSVISLIDMSFYVTSTNVIFFFFFLPSSTIFCSLNLYQLIFFLISSLVALLWTWTNHLKQFSLIFSLIEVTSIFKQISSFWIRSFQ